MAIDTLNQLTRKINFVLTCRTLQEKEYITEFPPIPTNLREEQEAAKDILFMFIKKNLPGSRIRPNSSSFAIKLDGLIQRKADKLRQFMSQNREWQNWLDNHHHELYRTYRRNNTAFTDRGEFRPRRSGEYLFVNIPFKLENIPGYAHSGLNEVFASITSQANFDVALAEKYDDIMNVINAEIARREEEQRRKREEELRRYKEEITGRLLRPITELEESDDPRKRLLAQKLNAWTTEQGLPPYYPEELSPENLIPVGTQVQVISQEGSREEGWLPLPPFEGFEIPEGYEKRGWGEVTGIDRENSRSRGGVAPVVVQQHIFLEFNVDFWKHLVPENYAQYAEAVESFKDAIEEEVAPYIEAERVRKEAEEARKRAEEERRKQEEADRIAMEAEIAARRRREEEERQERLRQRRRQQEEAERLEREAEEERERERQEAEAERRRQQQVEVDQLRESLLAQLGGATAPQAAMDTPVAEEVFEDEEDDDDETHVSGLAEELSAQLAQEPSRATETGVYRNSRAIPLEQYVVIREDGSSSRHATMSEVAAVLNLEDGAVVRVRDFHEPHHEVEAYEYNE